MLIEQIPSKKTVKFFFGEASGNVCINQIQTNMILLLAYFFLLSVPPSVTHFFKKGCEFVGLLNSGLAFFLILQPDHMPDFSVALLDSVSTLFSGDNLNQNWPHLEKKRKKRL